MRSLTLCACALFLALLNAAPATPAETDACHGADLTHIDGLAAAEARRADDLVNADGLLWRIDKPGLAPSYLYGAIHSTDDSALALARRAARYIGGAKVVATELGGPLDSVEKADIGAMMLARALDRDHDTFEGAVPAADRAPIEKLLAQQGFPSEFAHHLKLWFLAVATSIPACEARREALGLPEVDQFLAKTALRRGRQGRRSGDGERTDRRALRDPSGHRRGAARRRRARSRHERRRLCDHAAALPREPSRRDPADRRRGGRYERIRTRRGGRVHPQTCWPAATAEWPSAPRR